MMAQRPQRRTPARKSARQAPKGVGAEPGFSSIVGIGASAGGLEASIRLVSALPAQSGIAYVLVQHLDPTHPSLMAELLAGHTAMPVRQVTESMRIVADHVYVIPPGTYLAVQAGALRLSAPQARHGARLPFDFLLHSMAEEYGPRVICVVLSGTGKDGSLGIVSVAEKSGYVIVQKPEEAAYDGMPRSAIQTGVVDLVATVGEMPDAILRQDRRLRDGHAQAQPAPAQPADPSTDLFGAIIELLRVDTVHDFTLYKRGTLRRRIERRMSLVDIPAAAMSRYLDLLRDDPAELALLAKDLLINVTSFFRDPKVFALLEQTTIPELVRAKAADETLRVWVAGCSSGEETYSLAMLLLEQLAVQKSTVKLQLFASDVDGEAVSLARDGVYPLAIAADVPEERLARFFSLEEEGYRVQPHLRASIVFTVQDVLADPPFSRLDMISCRNLLIYLQPEAQAKVISLFHFALRQDGMLLLGNAESVGPADTRFEPIAKAERLYRRLGHNRSAETVLTALPGGVPRWRPPEELEPALTRQASVGDLGRRLVIDSFAPAAVVINRNDECLYVMGPTDRYLRVPSGHHSNDLLAMARPGMRSRLKLAIGRAFAERSRIVVPGGRISHGGKSVDLNIDVQPVLNAGEELLLVCFVDAPKAELASRPASGGRAGSANAALQAELLAVRAELQGTLRDLETANEEQRSISEEALSVNEEFQSTNEELLTSKEELQSLNEELTALNTELQETLDRQRTSADDLQNVLFSTDVATLFLDTELRIRFFTPASRALFNIIPTDLGRPLADLRSLAADTTLAADARQVLEGLDSAEREITTANDVWFIRRTLPYRAHDQRVEGVVITFTDITERKLSVRSLEEAKQRAEIANLAKTRFLAAASHDLRQPLQTLKLLAGLLLRAAETEKSHQLVTRIDDTLGAMSGMLNALLDINQIEVGLVEAKVSRFPVDSVLLALGREFAYLAEAQGMQLRVVPCSLDIDSDPRLLEHMLRNLLSNALKYTRRGRILLGCRRHADRLSIEIWDTGIGIPDDHLDIIFDEYHQLDNAARERSRGLGLGLSIVRRLGNLLGHPVRVRSRPGHGSVFIVDILHQAPPGAAPQAALPPPPPEAPAPHAAHRTGMILVVEDDPDVRDLLQLALADEGHLAVTLPDAVAALQLVSRGAIRPDMIITDYSLPGKVNGLDLATQLRRNARTTLPTVILTGDISTDTLSAIAQQGVAQLSKPVRLEELLALVQRSLPATEPAPAPHGPGHETTANGHAGDEQSGGEIFVVDDDEAVCAAIRSVLEEDGRTVLSFPSGAEFLAARRPGPRQCLLLDATLPGMDGFALLARLREDGHALATVMITGQGDVPMAVQAMKLGVLDFLQKPIARDELLASVGHALGLADDAGKRDAWRADARSRAESLTARQRQIMQRILAGEPNKNIAADLDISQRTVENHRAAIMQRMGAASLPALARLALAALRDDTPD